MSSWRLSGRLVAPVRADGRAVVVRFSACPPRNVLWQEKCGDSTACAQGISRTMSNRLGPAARRKKRQPGRPAFSKASRCSSADSSEKQQKTTLEIDGVSPRKEATVRTAIDAARAAGKP